jgi:hypothetical protein
MGDKENREDIIAMDGWPKNYKLNGNIGNLRTIDEAISHFDAKL